MSERKWWTPEPNGLDLLFAQPWFWVLLTAVVVLIAYLCATTEE